MAGPLTRPIEDIYRRHGRRWSCCIWTGFCLFPMAARRTKPCRREAPRLGTPGFGASGGAVRTKGGGFRPGAPRDGKSYTADTLELLHQSYPHDQLFLLMGTDMLLTFPQWNKPEKICRFATLAVMLRDREEPQLQERLQAQAQVIRKKLNGKVKFLKTRCCP